MGLYFCQHPVYTLWFSAGYPLGNEGHAQGKPKGDHQVSNYEVRVSIYQERYDDARAASGERATEKGLLATWTS